MSGYGQSGENDGIDSCGKNVGFSFCDQAEKMLVSFVMVNVVKMAGLVVVANVVKMTG